MALGWGAMSDNRVLESFEITQSVRFYSWRPRNEMPIAREEVIEHSANTHVIAADEHVRRIRFGDKTARVEHKRVVCSGIVCFDFRQNRVQLLKAWHDYFSNGSSF